MKAIFHKCYDDWGNLKDNALNIAYNLGKKEGLRKGKKIVRAEVIDEIKQKLKSTGSEITFNLPVEEILGEDIDLDDFAMLVQDAVQVYRKMVLGVLEELKEQK